MRPVMLRGPSKGRAGARAARRTALLLLLAAAAAGAAEMVVEVLPIRASDPAALVATIAPLVPEPGSVSAFRDRLVVKTTPENLEQVRRVLEKLDRRPRNLFVTVRFTRVSEGRGREDEASATLRHRRGRAAAGPAVRSGPGLTITGRVGESTAGARVFRTRSRTNERDEQRLRVLEGRDAFIRTGDSVPLAERRIVHSAGGAGVEDTITYRDVVTGFYLRARLDRDRVYLDIAPERARLSPRGGGIVETQRAWTTLSGPVGRWIEIGGSGGRDQRSRGGPFHTTGSRTDSARRIFVKVELAAE